MKSFFISLTTHFIILYVFIFTISPHKELIRPEFTFLGSILSKSEFLNITKKSNPTNKGSEKISFSITSIKKKNQFIPAFTLGKPPFKNKDKDSKIVIKTIIEHASSDVRKQKNIHSEKIMGIDINIKPRTPLKLRHDKD